MYKSFENSVEKAEISCNKQHSVFYFVKGLSTIFIKVEIVACKLFHFGRVQNLSFGKGLISCLSTSILEPFTTQSRVITTLNSKAAGNTVGKGENPGTHHFCQAPPPLCGERDIVVTMTVWCVRACMHASVSKCVRPSVHLNLSRP